MLDWHSYARFLHKDIWAGLHPLFVFLFGGMGVLLHKLRQRMREGSAAAWPSTDGVVQSLQVKPRSGGYWVIASYRYYVQQEYRYGEYRRHFRKKAAAQSFADAVRGRTLLVRYNPNDPKISVVMERDLQMAGILQMQ
jgi:Protein of unknown function (DUF3592)